jgi:hypothetical protein
VPPLNDAPHPAPSFQNAPKQKGWFLRHKVLVATLAVLGIIAIAAAAGSGSGDPATNDAGKTPSSDHTRSPKPAPTEASDPSPSTTPEPEVPSYGDGTYRVGKDIKAGTYRSGDDGICYWASLKGFGGDIDDIIANGNNSPAIVTLRPADKGFQSQGCGDWKPVATTFPTTPSKKFGDGAFMVGKDIAPGTYRSSGSGSCYWARRSSFAGGGIDGILANGNSPGIVTISSGDVGFETYGCGAWTR